MMNGMAAFVASAEPWTPINNSFAIAFLKTPLHVAAERRQRLLPFLVIGRLASAEGDA
jgi:hypothetical protein